MKPYAYPLFFLSGAASMFGASANATVGQSVAFSVTASGTAPFTYTWRKAGITIAGATANPYVIASAALADAGDYSAVVLNSAGSTISDIATLTVTAATTPPPAYAPDFSKSYAEAGLTGNYDPPVGKWQNGFAIIPIKKSRDPGNHFSDATGIYIIGPGEAGVYEIRMTLRAVDNPPPNVSVGLTSGVNNLDDKTGWAVTPPPSSNYIHWGLEHVNTRTLTDGAQIRCNVFVAAPITIQSFDVVIRRLY